MPEADGKAKVTGHTGRLAIDASLHHLKPARDFGPEYLTYVLWTITSEGRATNLGEVVPNGDGTANGRRPLGIPTVKVGGSLQRNAARGSRMSRIRWRRLHHFVSHEGITNDSGIHLKKCAAHTSRRATKSSRQGGWRELRSLTLAGCGDSFGRPITTQPNTAANHRSSEMVFS